MAREEEDLLGELGAALHGANIPAEVVEERLGDVAKRLEIEGDFFTLQSFLAMELFRRRPSNHNGNGVTHAEAGTARTPSPPPSG